MLTIDGSRGEGGGQILRTSLTLSLLTGTPFRLRKVRANRKPPGLKAQHLAGVRAAAAVGHATVQGDAVGSSDLTFRPGKVEPGAYRFPVGTAGATGLVLHAVYLPLALAASEPTELLVEGGTHVRTSPNYHFLDTTWRAWLALMGLRIDLALDRPGFYPRGGGLLRATVHPAAGLRPLTATEPAKVTAVRCLSASAGLPDHVADRQAKRLHHRMTAAGFDAGVAVERWSGGPGTMAAVAVPAGPVAALFTAAGERGKPAEQVADDAAGEAIAFAKDGGPVDEHSADQLLLPLALANGPSAFRTARVTRHLTTNAEVIRLFLDRAIEVEGEEGGPGVVRVAGTMLP